MDSHFPRLLTNQRTRNWQDVVKKFNHPKLSANQINKDACNPNPNYKATSLLEKSKERLVAPVFWQGGNEVCFFIADPIFVRKFLTLDYKSMTNFCPWSHKYGTTWSLIPKKTADSDPMVCDPLILRAAIPDPSLLIPESTPLIPDPTYLVTTLLWSGTGCSKSGWLCSQDKSLSSR